MQSQYFPYDPRNNSPEQNLSPHGEDQRFFPFFLPFLTGLAVSPFFFGAFRPYYYPYYPYPYYPPYYYRPPFYRPPYYRPPYPYYGAPYGGGYGPTYGANYQGPTFQNTQTNNSK